MAKDKLIDAGLMKMLMDSMQQSCQDTKRSAWTVMSVLCKHIPVPKDIQKCSVQFLEENITSKNPGIIYCIKHVMQILATALNAMQAGQHQIIKKVLDENISSFNVSTELVTTGRNGKVTST